MPGALWQFIEPNAIRALVVHPQDAQFGILHTADHQPALVLGEIVFVVAEEGEVVLDQPRQEGLRLFLFLLVDTGRGIIQLPADFIDFFSHNRKVTDRYSDFMKNGLQHLFKRSQVFRAAMPVNLQHNERLVAGIGGLLFRRMQFFQFALSVPLYLKYGVLNRVGTDFPLVNGNSQGIDQKRHVRMKNKNDRMR